MQSYSARFKHKRIRLMVGGVFPVSRDQGLENALLGRL